MNKYTALRAPFIVVSLDRLPDGGIAGRCGERSKDAVRESDRDCRSNEIASERATLRRTNRSQRASSGIGRLTPHANSLKMGKHADFVKPSMLRHLSTMTIRDGRTRRRSHSAASANSFADPVSRCAARLRPRV